MRPWSIIRLLRFQPPVDVSDHDSKNQLTLLSLQCTRVDPTTTYFSSYSEATDWQWPHGVRNCNCDLILFQYRSQMMVDENRLQTLIYIHCFHIEFEHPIFLLPHILYDCSHQGNTVDFCEFLKCVSYRKIIVWRNDRSCELTWWAFERLLLGKTAFWHIGKRAFHTELFTNGTKHSSVEAKIVQFYSKQNNHPVELRLCSRYLLWQMSMISMYISSYSSGGKYLICFDSIFRWFNFFSKICLLYSQC